MSGGFLSEIGGIIGNTPTPKNFYRDREAQWNKNQYDYDQRVQADADWQRNYDMQKEFAQNGVKWKIEDAARAGISPLAALGASGASASPISVGRNDSGPSVGLGESTAKMMNTTGQGVARAFAATRTGQEKQMDQLALANASAEVDGKVIDNQIKSSTLRSMQSGPSFPGSGNMIVGQGNSPLVQDVPQKRVTSAPGLPGKDPGAVNELSYMEDAKGTLYPLPAKDSKEAMEDSLYETMHFLRNGILPNLTGGTPPDSNYEWSKSHQGYRPKKSWLQDNTEKYDFWERALFGQRQPRKKGK